MTDRVQLAVIGAGPAGMAAAVAAADCGVEVVLLDEQPDVGGQVYRGVTASSRPSGSVLGEDYEHGAGLAAALARTKVHHWADSAVWNLTEDREIHLTREGTPQELTADTVIIATGALERPMPFPGWTLPGVMTAGAGQIMLKTAGLVPQRGLVLAGSGPLLLLVAAQYLLAGGSIEAVVETTPRGNLFRALRHLPGALRGTSYLRKGWGFLSELKRHNVPHFKGATALLARGEDRVESLQFKCRGKQHQVSCSALMLHIGVVPNVQMTRALNLDHRWNPRQRCWHPCRDASGSTALKGVFVAGDGAGIGGAIAAEIEGRMVGVQAARLLDKVSQSGADSLLASDRSHHARHMAVRPFLDTLYAPSPEFLAPSDQTIVCRCEEVTAGQVRGYVDLGCAGPNQVKSLGRSGMGPCQGRMCGLTVSEVIAQHTARPMADVGYYRVRPPIKPVRLGELAAMPDEEFADAE